MEWRFNCPVNIGLAIVASTAWPLSFRTFLTTYEETRKATGFKSLRVNCWEINLVLPNSQMDFLDKNFEKRSKSD